MPVRFAGLRTEPGELGSPSPVLLGNSAASSVGSSASCEAASTPGQRGVKWASETDGRPQGSPQEQKRVSFRHCQTVYGHQLRVTTSKNEQGGGGARPVVLLYCPGPSTERTRPLKHCLEALGASVLIRTDADLQSGADLPEVESPTSSSAASFPGSGSAPRSATGSASGPRTPSGWRRGDCLRPPDGGAAPPPSSRGSRPPSPERVPEPAKERLSGPADVPACDAVLLIWSQFFQSALQGRLADFLDRAAARGAVLLNDMRRLLDMQDRRWLLRKLRERGIPTPRFVECSRNMSSEPNVEEHHDYIVVDGQRINKPFVEKPVDRRDRDIYVYFPRDSGGGRALLSTRESGDVEYVCSFEPLGRVRREGSYVYQEYLQSDGLVVQAVCCGGQAYGNAVQSCITAASAYPTVLGGASSSVLSPTALGVAAAGDWASAAPVILRQDEKLIAQKISVILQQTLFGLTFVRVQRGEGRDGDGRLGEITPYVLDVWPGLPLAGFGGFSEDVCRALLAAICRRLPARRCLMRSRSVPPEEKFMPVHTEEEEEVEESTPETPFGSPPCKAGMLEEDLLCLLLVSRHGDRTPKQKAKAKLRMPSEFSAGWLCGWLAGAHFEGAEAEEPPAVLELRAPDQLGRLRDVVRQLEAAGHVLGVFHDAVVNFDKLGEACHAKLGRDAAVLTVSLKWGGELTADGVSASEALGRSIRGQMCSDIDVGSVRHDTKVYSSREPRCRQTAAAFCKGLLRLNTPALPPIVAALVRFDEVGSLEAGGGGKNYIAGNGRGGEEGSPAALGRQSRELETPWAELAASADPDVQAALRAVAESPALAPFATPGAALRELGARATRLQEALLQLGGVAGAPPLHSAETPGLLRERYKDTFGCAGLGAEPRSMEKIAKMHDLLAYDHAHNREAFPPAARAALADALPLAEALCEAQAVLQVARRADPSNRERDETGLPLLNKLRWDLRVASGADLGNEKAHLSKHRHLYGGLEQDKPCLRTRLYFTHNSHLQALLVALSRPPCAGCPGPGARGASAAVRLGFLAHFAIRLFRNRSTGEMRVTCDFGKDDRGGRACLFDLPLKDVDEWFTDLLSNVEDCSALQVPLPSPL